MDNILSKVKLFYLLVTVLTVMMPLCAFSGYYEDDCYSAMGGFNKSISGSRYITYDDAGVKEVCRNEYKTVNERYILRREPQSELGTIYKVIRNYCWARNWFRSNSCSWPTGDAWGDAYSAIFLSGDIRGLDDGDGRVILRKGGYNIDININDTQGTETITATGSGLYGDHVCLKRTAPRETLPHGGVNPFKRNAICAYLVYALAGDSCRNPVGGWNSALIGCIEEPIKAAPPTYNNVMAAEIAPFLDPKVTFEEYKTKYGSTFDQPVIKLLNGEVGDDKEDPNGPKIGELILRYKFPGDTTVRDALPSSGSFQGSKNQLIYKAIVDKDNPGQVCACEAADCDKRLYIGCVKRPTPRDSNLKVVAKYAQHSDKSPAVEVHFAITDANNDIIYYDADNQRVTLDSNGNAFKADQNGRLTNQSAKAPLTYKKLPLMLKNPIREYYVGNMDREEKERTYTRDVESVYGVQFQAIIPRMKSDGMPAFIALDTAETRTDGCMAIKIADDQDNEQKPLYFVPAGDRDRTYCQCISGRQCPVPQSKGCGAGMTDNEEDAAKVYCPGVLKEPSQVDKSNNICLQPSSGWEFADYKTDKLCTQIPTDCKQINEPSISYGISSWPKLQLNGAVSGACDIETGIEPLKVYQWSPATQILKGQFICNASDPNCEGTYAEYSKQFGKALKTLESLQALANALNRNLNDDNINRIQASLGNFSKYHKLTIGQTLAPQRSCNFNTELAKEIGLIKNSCMVQNFCNEIKKPAYINGFATWDKIGDNDLNPKDLDKSRRQMLAEILITTKGKCPAGYKEGDEAPTRICSLKYVNKALVGGGWEQVKNPCIPIPPDKP